MNKKLKGLMIVLVLIVFFFDGCNPSADRFHRFIKNCYFEDENAATFSDVNVVLNDSLIPVNAYIYGIGKKSGKNLISNKALETLFLLQKSEMKSDNFSRNDIRILYGDLLIEYLNKQIIALIPADLRFYLNNLYNSFIDEYKNNKLPNESDYFEISRYEKMLYLMGSAKLFKQDVNLLNVFRNDEYFTTSEMASKGIYIISAVNYLILRGKVANAQFSPLPFSTELIQKRKNELEKFKDLLFSGNSLSDVGYKLFSVETMINFSHAFNNLSVIDESDSKKIEKYLDSLISESGTSEPNGSLTYKVFLMYKSLDIAKSLNLKLTQNRVIFKFINRLNRSSDGVFVVYDKIYFDPWDTFWALFIVSSANSKKDDFYDSYKLYSEAMHYIEKPSAHSFEELFYADNILRLLGSTSNTYNTNKLRKYLESFFDFQSKALQDIYFFTLLSRNLSITLSSTQKENIKKVLSESYTNNLVFLIKKYFILNLLNENSEALNKIKKKIKDRISLSLCKVQDMRTLFYEYMFSKYVNYTGLQKDCIKKLDEFKTDTPKLFSMYRKGKEPSLMATYYGYEILYGSRYPICFDIVP